MKISTVAALVLACTASVSGCKQRPPEAGAAVQMPVPATAPAAPAPTAAAKPSAFDIASVPMSSIALPPFPLLDWPRDLPGHEYRTEQSDFDQAWVIAGDTVRGVEGRVDKRWYYNDDAKLSGLESRRNYAAAVAALGGVKVNAIDPDNAALLAANPADDFAYKKLGMVEPQLSYDAYLVRAPGKNYWITVLTNQAKTYLMTVEEKAMEQKVGFVSADAMRTELDRAGRIALYINFDTDKALLRTDARPAVDEITALLKKDPSLNLSIQGHTDNSGDAKRNLELSRQRADAVVATLIASGIDKARLSAEGHGPNKPLADNGSEEGRAKNRRVELVKIAAPAAFN